MTSGYLQTLQLILVSGKPYVRHVAAVALFGCLGIVSALLSGSPQNDGTSEDTGWSLPEERPVVLLSSVPEMLAQPIFGGDPVIESDSDEDNDGVGEDYLTVDWRLVGILVEGTETAILFVNEQTGDIENARLGDTLPGGETLKEINPDGIEVLDGDQSVRLSLFQDMKDIEE